MLPYPILLLLLAALVAASSLTIDWADCKAVEATSMCFANANCGNERLSELALDKYGSHFNPSCAVGISIRPFTDKIWLVRLQVDSTEFDPAVGIQFYVGNDLLLSCKADEGRVKIEGMAALKAELYGSDSRLTEDGGFCSFLVNDATSLPALQQNIKIEYNKAENKLTLIGPHTVFYVARRDFVSCNPLSLLTAKFNQNTRGYLKLQAPNILSATIDCSEMIDSDSPGVRLVVGDKSVNKIGCDKTSNKYEYTIDNESFEFNQEEEVFCGIRIETSCTNVRPKLQDPRLVLPRYIKDPTTSVTTLTCDDDADKDMQMMVYTLQSNIRPRRFYTRGKVKCRNSVTRTNAGAWFAHNGNEEVEFEQAECSNQTKCLLGPKFDSKNPPRIRGKTTTGAIKMDAEITCAEPDLKLEVLLKHREIPLIPSEVYCNFSRGIYTLSSGEMIGEGSNVYCAKLSGPAPDTSSRAGLLSGMTAGTGLVCLPFMAIFFFLIFRRWKKEDARLALSDATHLELPPTTTASRVSGKESVPATAKEQANKPIKPSKKDITQLNMKNPAAFEPTIRTWKVDVIEYHNRLRYLEYVLGRDKGEPVHILKFMKLLDCMFENETECRFWKLLILPFLVHLERSLFHLSVQSTTVAECYAHFRLWLIAKAEEILEPQSYGDDRRDDDEHPALGFMRGIAYMLLYKLNLNDPGARHAIVNKVSKIFTRHGMTQTDPCRMVIWGILYLEESGYKRVPGEHYSTELVETKKPNMLRYLLKRFNQLRKEESIMGDYYEGREMQHILFAMGCTLGRENMRKVWDLMKIDMRFKPRDFMFAMYARDWMVDSAWTTMCLDPSEHHLFCDVFGQDCDEYYELAEMCVRYNPDKYSEESKEGYNFEGFMQDYGPHFGHTGHTLRRLYKYYDRVDRRMEEYAVEIKKFLDERYKGLLKPVVKEASSKGSAQEAVKSGAEQKTQKTQPGSESAAEPKPGPGAVPKPGPKPGPAPGGPKPGSVPGSDPGLMPGSVPAPEPSSKPRSSAPSSASSGEQKK